MTEVLVMSYCMKCGRQLNETDNVCPICGTPVQRSAPTAAAVTPSAKVSGIPNRSIAVAIILSIVTCGIYSIYWFVCLTDEVNKASGNPNDTSGIVAFLLNLVTCGIYSFYWSYKIGEKCDAISGANNSSAALYLVLTLLGFGIVVYALAQNTLNNAVAGK